MSQGRAPLGHTAHYDLLLSVAEQLKIPLTYIARQAELGQLTGDLGLVQVDTVHVQATAALQLLDSYLLGLQLAQEQTELPVEPVSLSAVLHDTAHRLSSFAKQYEVAVDLEIAGRYEPVMAHSRGLQAALVSLGFALTEAVAVREHEQPSKAPPRLVLVAHRTPGGIVAGFYGSGQTLQPQQWRTALRLCGRAQQPFVALAPGAGAGLFVADTVLQAMHTRLRVGRYNHQTGLAVTLQPSQQLQFV